MLYKIDKNPDWNVFLNMAQEANLTDKSGEQQKVRIHKNPFPTLLHTYQIYILLAARRRRFGNAERCRWSAVVAARCSGRDPLQAAAAANC